MELLIVGGGLAAQRCIEALRAAGDDLATTPSSCDSVRPRAGWTRCGGP
jgi:hypothetical protein